jgi:hypothetical protein
MPLAKDLVVVFEPVIPTAPPNPDPCKDMRRIAMADCARVIGRTGTKEFESYSGLQG